MAAGIKKTKKQRKIRFNVLVVDRQVIEGVAEIVFFEIRIPSPVGIRIAEMSESRKAGSREGLECP